MIGRIDGWPRLELFVFVSGRRTCSQRVTAEHIAPECRVNRRMIGHVAAINRWFSRRSVRFGRIVISSFTHSAKTAQEWNLTAGVGVFIIFGFVFLAVIGGRYRLRIVGRRAGRWDTRFERTRLRHLRAAGIGSFVQICVRFRIGNTTDAGPVTFVRYLRTAVRVGIGVFRPVRFRLLLRIAQTCRTSIRRTPNSFKEQKEKNKKEMVIK